MKILSKVTLVVFVLILNWNCKSQKISFDKIYTIKYKDLKRYCSFHEKNTCTLSSERGEIKCLWKKSNDTVVVYSFYDKDSIKNYSYQIIPNNDKIIRVSIIGGNILSLVNFYDDDKKLIKSVSYYNDTLIPYSDNIKYFALHSTPGSSGLIPFIEKAGCEIIFTMDYPRFNVYPFNLNSYFVVKGDKLYPIEN